MQIPILTDGVVLLSGLSLRDATAQVASEDEEMARRFGWYPQHSTMETTRRFIRTTQQNWHRGEFRRAWAVREAATCVLVGGCELRLRREHTAHISWWTAPNYRGRRFATRAALLACDYAFANCGIDRVHAHIAQDNLSSRRVAEGSGFLDAVLDATERKLARLRNSEEMLLYVRTRPAASGSVKVP